MPFDRPSDDERPEPDRMLPPADRLWRHPSEFGGSGADGGAAGRSSGRSRPVQLLAVTAIVLGVALGVGVLWTGRPGTDGEVEPTDDARAAAAPARAGTLSVRRSLATVEVGGDGSWARVSGLWVDAAGTLAVPAVLLDEAAAIYVIGEDGRRQLARIAGVDEATGVATLLVADTDGVPARLDSRPSVGERVAIVGATDERTATAADPSTEVLAVGEAADVEGVVLHDAVHLGRGADGPAGSALVNDDGTVVAMVIGTDGDGRAIATPADTVRAVATTLRDEGEVRWARLGVRVVDATSSPGALVLAVDDDSPAATAGIRVDDVVTSVAGAPIADAGDLVGALRSREPGDVVPITVERDGERVQVRAELG